ncbi:MAG: hypothetical protein CL595_06720 [Alteromonas sp.]|mgnify:CR=1 FL=1|uniref:hypothetical protein n=1 Tax=Alteromonas australica TaxID=589873 RepID=UPI00069B0FC2|nr:hypothetical protein [Alteromonas australica]MAO29942.1 hypothetical protein [Alteromonas sp.]|tara:strand:- start:8398 stop:9249 length:852 start_codon:yes stop_codon:yes gene_type:complete
METKRVAICFFGITRSLSFTIDSVVKNVIEPAREIGEVKVFAHFFEQRKIENLRTGESALLNPNEHHLLKADEVELEQPDEFLASSDFAAVSEFGDGFGDHFQSLRNLFHQLYSLRAVTLNALEWNPDIVIFVRPDLQYHDSMLDIYKIASRLSGGVFVPNWQHWDGLNDRFAVAVGIKAIRAYGLRFEQVLPYCEFMSAPLHSEKLLKYVLRNERIKTMGIRASRVRADFSLAEEPFHHYRILSIHNYLAQLCRCSFDNKLLVNAMWSLQVLVYGNPYKNLK